MLWLHVFDSGVGGGVGGAVGAGVGGGVGGVGGAVGAGVGAGGTGVGGGVGHIAFAHVRHCASVTMPATQHDGQAGQLSLPDVPATFTVQMDASLEHFGPAPCAGTASTPMMHRYIARWNTPIAK